MNAGCICVEFFSNYYMYDSIQLGCDSVNQLEISDISSCHGPENAGH